MLKLLALSYTVMLNGYNQWLNMGGGQIYREIKVTLKYTVFMLFVH